MNRPFHLLGLSWLAAIFAAGLGVPPLLGLGLGGLGLGAAACLGRLNRRWGALLLGLALGFASLAAYHQQVLDPLRPWEGRTAQLTGVVEEVTPGAGEARAVLRVTWPGGPARGVRAQAYLGGSPELRPRDEVSFAATLYLQEEPSQLAQGTPLRVVAAGAISPSGHRQTLTALLSGYREQVRGHITARLPGPEGLVASALVTGDTSLLPSGLREAYARTGISHLLAVSGMHLVVLTGMLDRLLALTALTRRQRGVAGMAAAVAFVAFTGFPYSMVRAGIMAVVCRVALLLGRENDSLNALGLAVALILLPNPYAAYSVSLQLSYLATMGLCGLSGPVTGWLSQRFWGRSRYALRERRPGAYALCSALGVTVAASLPTLPVLAQNFGQLSLVSPVVNLLAGPLADLALVLGLCCGLLGFVPGLSLVTSILALGLGWSVGAMNWLAQAFGALPFAAFPLRGWGSLLWLAAAELVALLLAVLRASRRLRRYAACLLAVPLLAGTLAHQALWSGAVELLVPNWGSAVAVACGSQGALLGAPASRYESQQIQAFFQSRGVEELSLVVVRQREDRYADPVRTLEEAFPTAHAVALEQSAGFEASLFGRLRVWAGEDSRLVELQLENLRLAKAFEAVPARAHLLINHQNQLVEAPGMAFPQDSRYFSGTVIPIGGG